MKRMARTSLLDSLLLTLALAHAAWATPALLPRVFEYELDVSDVPALYGKATLGFTFTPTPRCQGGTELTVEVKTSESLRCLEQRTWSFPHELEARHSIDIEIDIPPDDTSFVEIWVVCGERRNHAVRYFVTTGEKLEVWSGSPRHYAGRKKPTPADTDRVPTREELNTKYEMSLDLRDSADYEFVNDLLGPLPEPIKPGFYRMRIRMENLLKLHDRAIKAKFLEDLPRKQPPADSTSDHESATDTLRKQSDVGRSPGL